MNKIIVMSHIGYDYDKQIIPNLSGVDVVVGGDSHTLLGPAGMAGYGVGSPAGAYPTEVKNKDGKRVCLVQAWEYSQVVGELKVSFDANGDVTACAGTPHVLMGSAYKIGGAAVSPADQAAIAADIKASGFLYPQEPDAGALAVLQPFKAKVDTFSASQVAKVPQELCSRRVPGGPARATTAGPAWTATRWAASACAAATSSSWLPRPIWKWATPATAAPTSRCKAAAACACPAGTVTAANVIEVVPFGNMLWRLNVTGAEVKSMLEDGMQAVYGPRIDRSVPVHGRPALRRQRRAAARQPGIQHRGLRRRHVLMGSAGRQPHVQALRAELQRHRRRRLQDPGQCAGARRQDIGVLDADVLQAYIDKQAKDPATGLPVLNLLPISQYSTKSYIE